MGSAALNAIVRALPKIPTRRAALRVLVGSAIAGLAGPLGLAGSAARKRKKKNKKKPFCLGGQTIRASKKKKKKLLRDGATPGACPPGCLPACNGQSCGADDGCGGTCGCGAGFLCHSGVCHPCDITCTGGDTACGDALKTALIGIGGGTVYVCPGRYVGNFELNGNGSVIGAGDGEDPASNTILDANGTGRVVLVNAGVTAALHGLRITGSKIPSTGGGIDNRGTLSVAACTIARNEARDGGGVHNAGSLTLSACTVSENTGRDDGGGVHNEAGANLTIKGCAITGNSAGEAGGGLYNQGTATATFDNASSVSGNTAKTQGGGIFNSQAGTAALNGATVSGNSPDNCRNVPTCTG